MYPTRSQSIAEWMLQHQCEYRTREELRAGAVAERGTTSKFASAVMRQLEQAGELDLSGYYYGVQASTVAPTVNTNAEDAMSALPGVINEESLRGEIDVHFKARRFLDTIQPGEFYRIDDAAVAAGVPKTAARAVFSDARYAANRGQAVANQQIYLGHPERIEAMKREGILR